MLQKTDNKEFFSNRGLKNTKSRNLIYNILEQSDVPVTAEQVFLKLKDSDSSVNLSTVYRILEIFVSKDIASRINITDSNKSMFELNRMEHKHHLFCIGCKKLFPMEGCPFEEYEAKIMKGLDFEITGHKFEIFGYCSKCKPERH